MNQNNFNELAQKALVQHHSQGLLRTRRQLMSAGGAKVRVNGQELVDFCSNDYLGLSHDPRLAEAVASTATQYGTGAGASALISGYTEIHAACEQALARWKGTEAAVLLPSGYQANHAAIQTLAAVADQSGKSPLFLLDKLSHASLIDAVRGMGADFHTYPHQDYGRLEQLLIRHDNKYPIVVTESVFSMDGDTLDVEALAQVKRLHPFTLLVDEAHAGGVYGLHGAGWLAERGASHLADVSIVTLSKALGCAGGAICGSRTIIDAVVNFGRAYIYSTSVTPIAAGSTMAALKIVRDEPWRAVRVREFSNHVREQLRHRCPGLTVVGAADSPIIPVILRTEQMAVQAADRLFAAGLLVLPIRPPTVPRGTSRLRITISAKHSDDQIEALIEAVAGLASEA